MSKNNGGPAFPIPGLQMDSDFNGMTLRDYFAAKTMHQFLAGAVLPTKNDRQKYLPMIAEVAYEMADAMIAERAK